MIVLALILVCFGMWLADECHTFMEAEEARFLAWQNENRS